MSPCFAMFFVCLFFYNDWICSEYISHQPPRQSLCPPRASLPPKSCPITSGIFDFLLCLGCRFQSSCPFHFAAHHSFFCCFVWNCPASPLSWLCSHLPTHADTRPHTHSAHTYTFSPLLCFSDSVSGSSLSLSPSLPLSLSVAQSLSCCVCLNLCPPLLIYLILFFLS